MEKYEEEVHVIFIISSHVVDPAEFTVLAGSTQRNATSDLYQADLLVRHPNTSINGQAVDVALIRVNKKINFGSKVKPIELDGEYASADNIYYLSGWGITDVSIYFLEFHIVKF